ncbi:DUF4349 domain-containing protein [Pilimelia columellifera]|uniref:DUF4349 domain-containing protein n=1 Tax=Pilimelia columellifera subsp. columellifera TaxID=706583 RepID=A0ABN3NJE7_9ACTN
MTSSSRFATARALAVTVAASLVAGCGADDASSRSAPAPAVHQDAENAYQDTAGLRQAEGQGRPATPAPVAADRRQVIHTGSLTVRVDRSARVDEAAAKAISIARAAGGYVGGDQRAHDGDQSRATVELRIPASRFGAVVDELAKVGDREEGRELSADDVTEQVVDLDVRIASQQASVTRTRALLARASSITELVSVEGELAEREKELASLQARQRSLADAVAMSTLRLAILGPDVAADGPTTGFVAGLKAGWGAFTSSLQVAVTVLGALLPWLVLIGVPMAGLLVALRRRRPAARVDPSGPTT